MTARELFDKLSFYLEVLSCPPDTEIVLGLNDPSVGPRASVGISGISAGNPMEHGQLRLTPEEPVFRNIKRLEEPCGIFRERLNSTGRIYYICKACRMPVNKVDRYCRECGHRLR